MIALALAAQIAAAAPPTVPPAVVLTDPTHRTQRAYQACNAGGPQLANAWRNASAKATTLNRLPKANYEIMVNRLVGGCPAPVIVRYDVGK